MLHWLYHIGATTHYFCPVALSRAREGLFILGNHLNLASRSHMWRKVIEELEENEAIGEAIPIVCHRHPDSIEFISEPGKLPRLAPDGALHFFKKLLSFFETYLPAGGCLRSCDVRLKCGHICPYKASYIFYFSSKLSVTLITIKLVPFR